MRFGLLYEHQLPRPWTGAPSIELFKDALAQVELADPPGHRLHLGGRASLPRGVRPLLGARGVPGGLRRRAREHPHRPRRGAGAARLQPSGPCRRAHRHPRPGVRRPRRLGTGESASRVELEGFGIDPTEEGDVGGGGRADRRHDGDEPLSRLQGQVLLHAGAQRGPQAVAEAASADLGGMQPAARPSTLAARPGIGALTFAFVDPAEAGKWAAILRDHQDASACRSGTR